MGSQLCVLQQEVSADLFAVWSWSNSLQVRALLFRVIFNDLGTMVGEFLLRWIFTINQNHANFDSKIINKCLNTLFWYVHIEHASSNDAVMQTYEFIFRTDLVRFKLKRMITKWLYFKWHNLKLSSSSFSRVVLQQSEYCLFTLFSDSILGFVSKVSVFQRFAAKLLNFLTHFCLKEQKIKFKGRL